MKGSERRSTERRGRRSQREALRRREDPTIYQVKQKLKKHPDLSYSSMSEEDITREAMHLTDQESLKQFFSDITHEPFKKKKTHEEMSAEIEKDDTDGFVDISLNSECRHPGNIQERQGDQAGQLTLKLHLSRLDETPSALTRFGIAFLKIPYGMLHARLEIGDSCNPEVTYIVEFNSSSLVQPRRKKRIECSALEATAYLGGYKLGALKHTDFTLLTTAHNQGHRGGRGCTGRPMMQDFSFACHASATPTRERKRGEVPCEENRVNVGVPGLVVGDSNLMPMLRPRSKCVLSRVAPPATKKPPCRDFNMTDPTIRTTSNQQDIKSVRTEGTLETEIPHKVNKPTEGNGITMHALLDNITAQSPPVQESRNFVSQNIQMREHPTEYELSLSKMLLINKLVSIIVQYNKHYYYQSITRNSQTFVVDVLQSFGVWESFTFGEKLEQYLENLTKGREEVYKCHKSVNDRVKYLVVSGEINELTYDEARYLRSLYTIYHLEESSTTAANLGVCTDHECLYKDLEKRLNEIRPEGALTLKSPEHYM